MTTTTLSIRSAPRAGAMIAAGAVMAFIAALFAPNAPFSIDEAIYTDMANAMASRGAFEITAQDLPAGAPVLAKSDSLVHVVAGKAQPQYPGFYGVIAAPFYALLGAKGLVLLNALAAMASLFLTYRIARTLSFDEWTAHAAVLLLGAASILPGYAFAVWPHALALTFALTGAERIAQAASADARRALINAALAGLAFGFGAAIRVDVILAALAGFFWLRLFARPGDRLSALALIIGLAPGLLVAALINDTKFGVFNPFSYGQAAGGASGSHYALIGLGVALCAAAALIIDVSSPPVARLIKAARARSRASFGALFILTAGAVAIAFPGLPRGLWVLIVDIQAYDGAPRPGEGKNAYGYWEFWGLPKKALLQSMPWLILALAPIIGFFRGEKTSAQGLLLIFAAAPITFFALNSWHGGMGYNLRYYLPAAPFLAILSADGLNMLRPVFERRPSLFLRGAIAGVFLAVVTYSAAPGYGEALARPMQLYPQLLLAGVLLAAIIYTLAKPLNAIAETVAGAASSAAIGAAAVLAFADAAGYAATRAGAAGYASAYAEVVPANALVVTLADEYMAAASVKGAYIVRAAPDARAEIEQAIAAYVSAGRCVYAHTSMAREALGADRFRDIALPATTPDPALGLFEYAENPRSCPA
ncbi:MAG: hypothetical protein AAFW81_11880 [Pseudomonadota bacterium]